MKRLAFYLMAACLLAGGACASHHSTTATSGPAASTDTAQMASAKPINQYCPIDKENKVDPTVTTVYKGKVIGFCCSDCIPEFKKDPEKYMATLK